MSHSGEASAGDSWGRGLASVSPPPVGLVLAGGPWGRSGPELVSQRAQAAAVAVPGPPPLGASGSLPRHRTNWLLPSRVLLGLAPARVLSAHHSPAGPAPAPALGGLCPELSGPGGGQGQAARLLGTLGPLGSWQTGLAWAGGIVRPLRVCPVQRGRVSPAHACRLPGAAHGRLALRVAAPGPGAPGTQRLACRGHGSVPSGSCGAAHQPAGSSSGQRPLRAARPPGPGLLVPCACVRRPDEEGHRRRRGLAWRWAGGRGGPEQAAPALDGQLSPG